MDRVLTTLVGWTMDASLTTLAGWTVDRLLTTLVGWTIDRLLTTLEMDSGYIIASRQVLSRKESINFIVLYCEILTACITDCSVEF